MKEYFDDDGIITILRILTLLFEKKLNKKKKNAVSPFVNKLLNQPFLVI
jgi:hypothetical protein